MQRSPKLDRLKSTKYKRALFVFFAGLRLQRREFGAGVVVVVVSNGSRNATPRVLPRRDTFTEGVELTSFFFSPSKYITTINSSFLATQ